VRESYSHWIVVSENGRRRPGFVMRWLVTAFGLWVASLLVSGIIIKGVGTLIHAALLFGIVNAIVRPIVVILTLPFTVLTLGLFLLVVNGAMLALVASMLESFQIRDLFSAILGSIIVSAISWGVSR
jgi:putative membrane protein